MAAKIDAEVLQAGTTAPKFKLPSGSGEVIDLADVLGKKAVVLYFYPKADTSGCTTQACGFRDAITDFSGIKAAILGVSPDPPKAVAKFAAKYNLNFPLLADEDHSVCEKYGVWQQKSMYGRKYMGVVRTTFILNPAGKIVHVFQKVKPQGHEQEVLQWLQENRL